MTPKEWLKATDSRRREALREAATAILGDYAERYPSHRFIRLHPLVEARRALVRRMPELGDRGRLLARRRGFDLLVSENLDLTSPKGRSVLAHELVHTLFYSLSDGEGVPSRLVPRSKGEHDFCYDAARLVLVPPWLLTRLRLESATPLSTLLESLTDICRVSRSLAARLILDDYGLRSGIAGRWRRVDRQWKREFACASSLTTRRQRDWLSRTALFWIREADSPPPGVTIVGDRGYGRGNAYAFAIAAIEKQGASAGTLALETQLAVPCSDGDELTPRTEHQVVQ